MKDHLVPRDIERRLILIHYSYSLVTYRYILAESP